jgi:hypothetical protein
MQKEVFLVQWITNNYLSGSNDVNTYVWDNELGALVDACDCILDHLDIVCSDPIYKNNTDTIRDFIKQQKYHEAINEFNFLYSGLSTSSDRISVYVLKGNVHSKNVGVSRAHPMATNNPNGYHFSSDKCGAKCRKCSEVNDYAYPDNVNGTYICYGCRNFGS